MAAISLPFFTPATDCLNDAGSVTFIMYFTPIPSRTTEGLSCVPRWGWSGRGGGCGCEDGGIYRGPGNGVGGDQDKGKENKADQSGRSEGTADVGEGKSGAVTWLAGEDSPLAPVRDLFGYIGSTFEVGEDGGFGGKEASGVSTCYGLFWRLCIDSVILWSSGWLHARFSFVMGSPLCFFSSKTCVHSVQS